MRRQISALLVLIWAIVALVVSPAWAIDPVLQEAQRKLSGLGYDIGMADGIYGPRTRQALETFQQQQHLPVTGILDTATLQALDRVTSLPPAEEPRETPVQDVPLRVVLTYLRFYAFQPARVLPYLTEKFRGGLSPQEWVEQTLQTLAAEDYAYLGWQIQRVEVADAQATVEVHTRVRTKQQEQSRQEVFGLQRTADGAWLINEWHVDALPPDSPKSQMGS
jgi:peptidoglycan hydrolase-like protein with peptidoglycan-binding domain